MDFSLSLPPTSYQSACYNRSMYSLQRYAGLNPATLSSPPPIVIMGHYAPNHKEEGASTTKRQGSWVCSRPWSETNNTGSYVHVQVSATFVHTALYPVNKMLHTTACRLSLVHAHDSTLTALSPLVYRGRNARMRRSPQHLPKFAASCPVVFMPQNNVIV